MKQKQIDDGKPRRSYTLKVYVDKHIPPPSNARKISRWSVGFDERGYFWTKIIGANKREEAVAQTLLWFRNGKCRAKKRSPNGNMNAAFNGKKVDEVAVVSDDYNEVFYNDFIRNQLPKYRLLPPERIDELEKKSKGLLVGVTDFKNYKGSGCIYWNSAMKKAKFNRERFEKLPAPFLYREVKTGTFYAKIVVKPQITKGTIVKYMGAERKGSLWTRPIWETKAGKKVQSAMSKYFKLKSIEVIAAAKEARKLYDEQREILAKKYGANRRGHKKVIVSSKKQIPV